MRIVLPVDEKGRVYPFFEKTSAFVLYEKEDSAYNTFMFNESSAPIPSAAESPAPVLSIIKAEDDVTRQIHLLQADAVVCGMMSDPVKLQFAMSGIEVFAGVYGKIEDVIDGLMSGALSCLPDTIPGRLYKHDAPCAYKESI